MARAYASIVLKAPVETVWGLVRDFNSLPKWAPAVARSKIEGGLDSDVVGCVRSLYTRDGAHVRERLLTLDDANYTFAYNFEKPAFPVKNYVATVRLYPITRTDETFAEWEATFERCLLRKLGQSGEDHRRQEAEEAGRCGALEGLSAEQGMDIAGHPRAGGQGMACHARLCRYGRLARGHHEDAHAGRRTL
jgi:hypothetical protein